MEIIKRSELVSPIFTKSDLSVEEKRSKLMHRLESYLGWTELKTAEAEAAKEVMEAESLEKARRQLLEGKDGEIQMQPVGESEEAMVAQYFATSHRALLLQVVEEAAEDRNYVGEVFGIACHETGRYYLMEQNRECRMCSENPVFQSVGLIVTPELYTKLRNEPVVLEGYDFFGTYRNGSWMFRSCTEDRTYMTMQVFSMVKRLFSRNTGLLETSELSDQTAVIVGNGSVGSLIARELAKAGVGHMILVDGDILEIHNVCRHQLGFRDVGRYKVDATAEDVHNINPWIEVKTFRGYLQEAPTELFKDIQKGIVIGTADNRAGNAAANDLADVLGLPFTAIGCWSRAHAGEVFYWYPDAGLPTYREAFASLITEERPEAHSAYFGAEDEKETMNFETGISADIAYVTIIGIKVILDLLGKSCQQYTQRVLEYLKPYTLICNTNKPELGGEGAAMFPHPLFISHSIRLQSQKAGETMEFTKLEEILNEWILIEEDWNDQRSKEIEANIIVPLRQQTHLLQEKAEEIESFIGRTEEQLEALGG